MEKKSTTDRIQNGRYQLRKLLGSGGMSAVFAALDLRTGNPVVVKQCANREAELLSALEHPGIVRCLDMFQENGQTFLVEEFLEGTDLFRCVQEDGPFPLPEALRIGRQICGILEYLHGRNPPVIYRDMKPANMILQKSGRVVLVDFGIAREYMVREDSDTNGFGTPMYAAPEQYGEIFSQSDGRADLYALGKTMFYLLTGILPAKGDSVVFQKQVRSHIEDPEAAAILLKCTEADPEKRYQSAEALSYAITVLLGKLTEEEEGGIKEYPAENRTLYNSGIKQRKNNRRTPINPAAVALTVLGILVYVFGFLLGVSKAYNGFASQTFRLVSALPYWGIAFAAGTLVMGFAQVVNLLQRIYCQLKER